MIPEDLLKMISWHSAGPRRVMICPASISISDEVFFDALPRDILNTMEFMKHAQRRREFLVSRFLTLAITGEALSSGNYGEPLWPDSWRGSVSHKGGHVALCLVRGRDSVGIDLEACRDFSGGLDAKIMGDDELLLARSAAFGASAVFSAKEAIYKALFPSVLKKFWFDAARLIDLAPAGGDLVMDFLMTRDLSSKVPEGYPLRVYGRRIDIDGDSFWLTSCQASAFGRGTT